jgi:hypothetical protein
MLKAFGSWGAHGAEKDLNDWMKKNEKNLAGTKLVSHVVRITGPNNRPGTKSSASAFVYVSIIIDYEPRIKPDNYPAEIED